MQHGNLCRIVEKCMDLHRKYPPWRQHMLLLSLIELLCISFCHHSRVNEPCQEHWYNPIPSQSLTFGLLNFGLANINLDGPFCLWSRADSIHFFSKNDLEYWLVCPHYTTLLSVPDEKLTQPLDKANTFFLNSLNLCRWYALKGRITRILPNLSLTNVVFKSSAHLYKFIELLLSIFGEKKEKCMYEMKLMRGNLK